MLYAITRPFATLAFKVYFRKIYLAGLEHLPEIGPVILAPNHPTAFLEPCLLACLLPRPVHFMARGDLFSKPLFNRILRDFNMIPIYRRKEGFEQIRQNIRTIGEAEGLLQQGKVLMIMAEGGTNPGRRLKPVQKGVARVALSTLEKDASQDIPVIPVGFFYPDDHRFRSRAFISLGPPVSAADFTADYTSGNQARALRSLTEAVSTGLKKEVIQIARPERENTIEQLVEMYLNDRSEGFFPAVLPSNSPKEQVATLCWSVEQLPEEKFQELQSKLEAYREALARYGLEDSALSARPKSKLAGRLFLGPGLLLYWSGIFLNAPPLLLAQRISKRKVRKRAYFSSVRLALGLVLYLFYLFLLGLVSLLLFSWPGLAVLPVAPLLGFFVLYFRERLARWKFRQLPGSVQKDLSTERKAILEMIN